MITMLCGIVSLVCILRQQRIIQLQKEEIRRCKRDLVLRDKQSGTHEAITPYGTDCEK